MDGDPCTTAARAARRSAFDADILQSVESRHTDFVMTGNLVVFRKISSLCFKQINRQSLASLLEGQLVLLTLLRFDHLVAMFLLDTGCNCLWAPCRPDRNRDVSCQSTLGRLGYDCEKPEGQGSMSCNDNDQNKISAAQTRSRPAIVTRTTST